MEAESIVTCSRPPDQPSGRALAEGEALRIDEAAPRTLVSALQHTAARYPHKGIHFIQQRGEARFLPYPSLLNQASRIREGLRTLGLEAGTKVILQLETLETHYAAFWGCLLAGIVPVAIAIPSAYREGNGVVNKLFNTWGLLDKPPIITTSRLREPLGAVTGFLPMDPLNIISFEALLQSPPTDVFHEAKPSDVAFMQLSSGSTGVPKCIQETHQGVIAHIHSSAAFNGYSSEDITLNWLPVDHVVPLLTFHLKDVYLGCTQVHVPTDFVLADPLLWLDLLEQYRVTHTWSPNFGFKLVSDRLDRSERRSRDLSSVKFFMNAGEQVTVPVVRDFLRAVAPFGVLESAMQPAFGMAEVCTCMTYANHFSLAAGAGRFLKSSLNGQLRPADGKDEDAVEFVGLGKVAPGVSIRITGADNQVVSEKVIGRLQIKGPVVTPAYFNNEEANRDAFVGEGWFNTGDLGFIANGELFLTGREKEIIVIRGAKFYCYEVEDIVDGMIGVEPTYVASCGVSNHSTGTETLALFFSPQGITDEFDLARAIRRRLASRLGIAPGYVIPIPKEEFPRTTSGKIQRSHLKKLLEAGAFDDLQRQIDVDVGAGVPAAPQNEIERRLIGIWREVLGPTAVVGSTAQFFDLGGDSLKAAQIISRIREQWALEFPLELLFDGLATVSAMAAWIAQNQGRREANAPATIQPTSRTRDLPLSYSQLRIWLAEQIEPGTSLYNICRVLTLQGAVHTSALEQALNQIIQRHEILRTVYHLADMPVQEVLPEMPLTLPRHDLVCFPERERRRIATNLIDLEVLRPFELATGPLFRAKLIRLDEKEHWLVLTFHQLVTDAWSLGLFFRELAALYGAAVTGSPAAIPPVPVQYADYAVWQQRWFSDAGLEKQLKYWKRKLDGPLPVLALRPDRQGAVRESSSGAVQTLVLQKLLLEKIRALGAAEGVTLYMTLLAAFKLLLCRWTGETDLPVGSPESGRRRLETENLLGCFVNMLVLRTRCAVDDTFRRFLNSVRQTALEACAHADVPFEKLTASSSGTAGHKRKRLFQIWCGPIDSLQPFSIPKLRVLQNAVFPPEAQFDLSLFVSERADQVDCFFEYRTEVLSSAQATRMIRQYERLLSRVVASPEAPITELLELLELT